MKRVKPILDVLVAVLVVIAASLVIWRQASPEGQSSARPPVEDAGGTIPPEIATHVRGTGVVTLVEFADFECPACGRFARDVEPMLQKAFVDTGVVRQVFVNYPLSGHARAEPASEAAICAGKQGKFWEMRDALLRNQARLGDADLTERAREIGLDAAVFSDCMSGGKERSLIERHRSAARSLDVRGTPTFFLGMVEPDGSVLLKKRINGAVPFGDFYSAIMEVIPRELRERVGTVALDVPGSID